MIGLQALESLDLTNNYIATIFPEAFSGLIPLKKLYLGNNYLSEIHGNMWVGLQSLERLDLQGKRLTDIPRHGISHMPLLATLELSSNHLTTLRDDVINPDDYPDSYGHPPRLRINLSNNPIECDSGLCWLVEVSDWISITFSKNTQCALNLVELGCTSGEHFC